MKRLLKVSTWVVVALVIVGGITLVARQQQTASEKYERDRESRCVATFPIASEAEKQDACKHEKDSGKNYLQWWYVLLTWPEGITTWAIIATGFVIGWQALETRKSANGAKEAAQAALLNAQALINSERPWLLVSAGYCNDDPEMPEILIVNKGRTPAKLISHSDWQVQLREQMPVVPIYGKSIKWEEQKILLPDEPMRLNFVLETRIRKACGSNEVFERVRNFSQEIYIFGVIYYQDLLDTLKPATHETRWCIKYLPGGSRIALLIPHGPEGYNAHT